MLDVPRTKTLLIIYCSETCSAPQLVHFNQSLQSWEAPWLRTNRRDVRGSGRERIPAFNIPTNSQHKQDAASLIQLRLNQSSLEKGTLRDQQCETPNYSVVSSKSAPKGRPQTGGGGTLQTFFRGGGGGSAPSSNPLPFHIPCTFDGQGTIFVYLPLKCSTPLAYPLRNKSLKQEGPLSFSYFRVTFNKLNGQNAGLFETLLRPF